MVEVEKIRSLIDRLRRDRRTHPYQGRAEYSGRAREVAAAIGDLIGAGRAVEAVPLARRAVERVTAALEYMDDSSGIVGTDLRELMAIYARACTVAPPDAKRLAAWLVKLQLDGPGWPRVKLAEFAAGLGARGLAEVARLAEERAEAEELDSWAQLGVTDLREQLAAVSGDVDAHVAVLAQDLCGSHRYLEIAEVLLAAGRDGDAEEWARQGLKEHSGHPQSPKLRDLLVNLLLLQERKSEAVGIRREAYERRSMQTDFSALKDTASRAGDWAKLRPWALQLMRDRAEAKVAYLPELIGVLLAEDLQDEAWGQAVAKGGELHESRWMQLIELREIGSPADVIGPYQELIEQRLAAASDNYRYNKAVKLIVRLREAYRRSGDTAGFATYLDELRDRHRRKTAFLAKLDKAGLEAEPY